MNQANFAADRFSTITKWRSTKGINIIYPKHQTPEGKGRGECFLAAPVFGEVPQNWKNVDLPRHGLIRNLPTNYPAVSSLEVKTGTRFLELNIPPREGYPWGITVGVMLEHLNPHQVDYWVSVHRQQDCGNKRLMPLSFGLHPYFATHGNIWRIISGNTEVTDSRHCHKNAKYFDCVRGQSIYLQTSQGTVKLELRQFDRFVIWSDNPEEYICIEPTLGLRQELLLEPGVMKHGGCRMEFIETPRHFIKR